MRNYLFNTAGWHKTYIEEHNDIVENLILKFMQL